MELTATLARSVSSEKIIWPQIWTAFKDPKSYLTATIYGALCLGIASITSFLPTFISEFGFSRRMSLLCPPIPLPANDIQ
jgi:hypothetical protein